jgi:predicted amidophosphoribosyltransferase
MKERTIVSTYQLMDGELIDLLLKHFGQLIRNKKIGGIITIPSSTWKARESILHFLSSHFSLPILKDAIRWKEVPQKRQGELLNNDQRHHNVHQKMEFNSNVPIPNGSLILLDDYIGSGNTLKEAARAIRTTKAISNELIPFTIAAVKWHLGKPGFS